jgi:hypothetical protein
MIITTSHEATSQNFERKETRKMLLCAAPLHL